MEVKTPDELKAAAERQPIIPLTLGHPSRGYPQASDFIGTVNQKWNEAKQRVDAEFWFYDEVPDEVRQKIVNGWPTPISAGFTVEKVENGAQKGVFYTHVAILRDTDDPKCPLGQCGVNVRMESNLTEDNYRYEQATDPSDTTDRPKKTEPYDPVSLGMVIGELRAEVAALRKELNIRKEEPVPQKQEVESTEAHAEPPEASQQETPRATQRILPAGELPQEEELKRDNLGRIILS